MTIIDGDPVRFFAHFAEDASYRMMTTRNEIWVGDLDERHAEKLGVSSDIYSGMRTASQSVMRVVYNEQDHTIMLLAAKAPYVLQGQQDTAGRGFMTDEGLESCYILDAYRLPPEHRNPVSVPPKMARDLNETWERYKSTLLEDSRANYTLYRARLSDLSGPYSDHVNVNTHTEIFTNERFFYTLDQNGKGSCDVRFYELRKKKNNGFSEIALDDKFGFNKVSKVICADASYPQAVHEVAKHWGNVTSKLWDGRFLHPGEGLGFAAKKMQESIRFWPSDNIDVLERAAAVGTLLGSAGWAWGDASGGALGAFGGAFGSVGLHVAMDESFNALRSTQRRRKEARAKDSIEDYSYDRSVLDYYLYPEFHHFRKASPKVNLEKCHAENLRLLNFEQCRHMVPANVLPEDGMRPSDIRGLMHRMDCGGYPSLAPYVDRNTRANEYLTGLMMTKSLRLDGKVVFFGKARDDLNFVPQLAMPPHYHDQMENGIMRVEWDVNPGQSFHKSFNKRAGVSVDEMMGEMVNDILFIGQPGVDERFKQQSYSYLEQAFSDPCFRCLDYMQETGELGYASGQPAVPPDVKILEV